VRAWYFHALRQYVAVETMIAGAAAVDGSAAVALTTDTSALTSIGNDLGFDQVFSRQVEALVRAGDLLVVHSTSGNSPNVVRAAEAARGKGARVLALTARDGGAVRPLADVAIVVPTDRTDRAQELHLIIQHVICELAERDA